MKRKNIVLVWMCGISSLCGAQVNDSSNICKADFDYYRNYKIMSLLPGAAIQFEDLSKGAILSWTWTLGTSADTFSAEQNPMHFFNYPSYPGAWSDYNTGISPAMMIPSVTLKIIASGGCTSSITKPIYFNKDSVYPPLPNSCYVYFKAMRNDTLSIIPENIPYSFRAEAPANVISWRWDFGDGTGSNEANPEHIYPFQNASYKVCVNILTADSCTSSYCSYVYVGNADTSIVPSCNALFIYENLDSDPNYWHFTNKSSNNAVSCYWDFGDGTFSTEQVPPPHFFRRDTIPDSLGYFHIVNSSGIFKVCLTTVSANSCSSTYCDYVNTTHTVDSSFINPCGYMINLVSSNTLGSTSCKANASARLIDSLGNSVPVSSYYWSNGSSTETAENLCANTTYYLKITAENGCQTAGSFAIMDYTRPYSTYGYWTVSGTGSNYNFKYNLPDSSYTCNWIFSDSTQKTGSNINYNFAYPDSDNYVRVIVKDSTGKAVYTELIKLGNNEASTIKAIKSQTLKVYPNPVRDELQISMPVAYKGLLDMQVYDAVGRIVKKSQVDVSNSLEIRLNTSDLWRGFYILSLSTNNTVIATAKFAK